jgi:hypothetical protein
MYGIVGPGTVTGFTSEALGINASGVIVGVLHPSSGSRDDAFVWDSSLSVLPDRGYGAEARAINSSGIISGAVETMPGRLAAAMWSANHTLTLLKEPADAVFSFTHGIDDQGRIVGGYLKPGPMQLPLFWTAPAATPVVAAVPGPWAEALSINSNTGSICGATDAPATAFLWNGASTVTPLGNGGAMAIRGPANEMVGTANNVPVAWHGGSPSQAIPLDALAGRVGTARDLNGTGEIVGDLAFPGPGSPTIGFLRRGFRRDETDPNSPVFLPKPLQLAQPETIDLNTLLPPQSGWTLTSAAAINESGQIAGTGLFGNQASAYRLSPPKFESPFHRFLKFEQVVKILGGVAVDGGGFIITAGGQIIPVPPPRPDTFEVERVRAVAREAVMGLLSAETMAEGMQKKVDAALRAGVEDALRGSKGR